MERMMADQVCRLRLLTKSKRDPASLSMTPVGGSLRAPVPAYAQLAAHLRHRRDSDRPEIRGFDRMTAGNPDVVPDVVYGAVKCFALATAQPLNPP
jgi:hypothetical protein